MEFLPSKKLSHADRLSRLTPRFCKPLEDAVIVAIRAENEINNIYNTVRELPITLEEIRINFEKDNCIMKIKKQEGEESDEVMLQQFLSEFWEDGVIKKRISKMTYMVQGQRWEHKPHLIQLKRRFTDLVTP